MIPVRTHAIIDYVIGVLLVLAPFIFGFGDEGAAAWVPILLGLSIIVYSLLTQYELAVKRVIPLTTHMVLDALGGLLLIVSPWLFGFADEVWWPHVLVGIAELVVLALTDRKTAGHREV